MTKENFYNRFSSNEKLELNWASQASCIQRAGRAGRVADGEVFRLVPKCFYDRLSQFSTPEMRRCPLDKLILQIKMWNYKEPKHLLGAAIEPPQLSDVEFAIRRLQDAGAITLQTKDQPTGQITYLGQIYCDMPCDIKITRLCMLGLLFSCMKQAIIMAGIIQQEKSLFNETQSYIDPIKLHNKFSFALPDSDSDLIMFYNAYNEWYKRYVERQEIENPGFYRRRFISSRDEQQWCKRQGLNLTTLKEAYRLVQELRERFLSFGLNEELLNMDIDKWQVLPKSINNPSKDKWLVLKLAIAGAFYPRYMNPHHFDLKTVKQEELKRKDIIPRPHNLALMESKESNYTIVKSYFEQFGTIEQIIKGETSYNLAYTVESERNATLQALKLQGKKSKRDFITASGVTRNQEEAYMHIRPIKVCSPFQITLTDILR